MDSIGLQVLMRKMSSTVRQIFHHVIKATRELEFVRNQASLIHVVTYRLKRQQLDVYIALHRRPVVLCTYVHVCCLSNETRAPNCKSAQ